MNFFHKHHKLCKPKQLHEANNWAKSKNRPFKKKIVSEHQKDLKAIQAKIAEVKPQVSSDMFFSYNEALGPPYRVLLDTNFINFAVQNKLDIIKTCMDCLYAKCTPVISDCVVAELEKLGRKFNVALKAAKDPRFERLKCNHKGIYADDCICKRVEQSPVFVVATCDRDLKRRLRKIPGVPIMVIKGKKFEVERLPEVNGMG